VLLNKEADRSVLHSTLEYVVLVYFYFNISSYSSIICWDL